jgi:uncharacterized membrane protein YeaQ/YmgE (transglycosylase-associated protein family)
MVFPGDRLEVGLTFSLRWDSVALIQKSSPFFFFFLILLGVIGAAFLAFFLLTLLKAQQALAAVFEKSRAWMGAFLAIASLSCCARPFCSSRRLHEHMVYNRFAICGSITWITKRMLPAALCAARYALFWEILACFIYQRGVGEKTKFWLGLPFLLAGNFFLRYVLEQSGTSWNLISSRSTATKPRTCSRITAGGNCCCRSRNLAGTGFSAISWFISWGT